MRLLAEPGHGRRLDLRRQRPGGGGGVVEGVDLGGHGLVLVGDDPVREVPVRVTSRTHDDRVVSPGSVRTTAVHQSSGTAGYPRQSDA